MIEIFKEFPILNEKRMVRDRAAAQIRRIRRIEANDGFVTNRSLEGYERCLEGIWEVFQYSVIQAALYSDQKKSERVSPVVLDIGAGAAIAINQMAETKPYSDITEGFVEFVATSLRRHP